LQYFAFYQHSYSARLNTGVIWGNVTDSSHSIVQQAEVTARNAATGRILKGTSNAYGAYRLNAVPPGRYEVSVVLPGVFKGDRMKMFDVNVDARVKIDIELKIGNVAEEVRVSTETSLLESDTTFQTDRL